MKNRYVIFVFIIPWRVLRKGNIHLLQNKLWQERNMSLHSTMEKWLIFASRFFFRNERRFTLCFWIYSSKLQKIAHFMATKCMQPQSLAMHLQRTHSSSERYFWSPVQNPFPLNISYNKVSSSTVQYLSNATINKFFPGQRTVKTVLKYSWNIWSPIYQNVFSQMLSSPAP